MQSRSENKKDLVSKSQRTCQKIKYKLFFKKHMVSNSVRSRKNTFKLSTEIQQNNSRNTNTTNQTCPSSRIDETMFQTVANTRQTIRKYRVVKGNHFRGKEPIPNKSAKSKQAKHNNSAISEAKKQSKICETRDGKEKTERKMF